MASDKDSLQPIKSSEDIRNKIYTIRGVQVMLDSDLAELYQVETKALNQAVKRNPDRFPKSLCFQLTMEDIESSRSQIVTLNKSTGRGSNIKYLPHVFTESGVAMLSAVLHSTTAIQVSLCIMKAFVEMRHYLADNALVFERLDRIEIRQIETDKRVDTIFKQLEEPREKKAVLFFKGQMYDAFSCIARIISQAKSDIILIDGYVDTGTLDLLSKKKKAASVAVYTSASSCKLTQKEIADFNNQYGNLTVNYTTEFHDRFMILDRKSLYHIGASIKDVGKKAFELSLIDDDKQTEEILNRLS